ncbi:MAG: hypothetical protein RR588_16230, partial [Solibacillus sp.]
MKLKKMIVGLMIVIGIGVISLVRINQPLEHGPIASTNENKSVVIGIGNKGFSDIQLTNVFVNNGETPAEVKMQIQHPDKGFILTDDFTSPEAAAYNFSSLKDTKIKKRTIMREIYERQDKKQVKEDEKIYGLSILNDQPI